MSQELIESLWESFKKNYNRCQKALDLPEYTKVVSVKDDGTVDIVGTINGLVALLNQLELKGSWNQRQVSAGKNLLFLLHKIHGIQENSI